MKLYQRTVLLCLLTALPAAAQLAIPSDGSDGALNITSNTVIDLSQAVTGVWSDNNTANVGKGIYDTSKWAVVFKYSSVTIASNATVTFKNHGSRAPVVWLVSSNVVIDGELDLSGKDWNQDLVNLPEPGPGGFRGGAAFKTGFGNGSGLGPGGNHNDSGSYSTGRSYGNPQVVPLIGGSGGAGGANQQGNGAGGGGAILIASGNSTTVNGRCRANGGSGYHTSNYGLGWYGFAGSGGAIRLISNQILGNGQIEALYGGFGGSLGRIRLEANDTSGALSINPMTVTVAPTPLVVWPDASAPTVKLVSVGGQSAPLDPNAEMSAGGDDLTIANTNTVAIILETANFPTNGTVNVYIKPRNNAQSILPASFVSGNGTLATWQLQTVLPLSHTVIQARAVAQ